MGTGTKDMFAEIPSASAPVPGDHKKSAADRKKSNASEATSRDIVALSRPERPVLILGMILRAGAEASGLLTPLVLAIAWEEVAKSYGAAAQYTDENREVIKNVFVVVLAMHLVGNLLGFFAGIVIGVSSERVVTRLRTRLYSHILSMEMGFFDEHKSGDLVSRLGSDTVLVQAATTQALNEAVIAVFKVVSSVVLMFFTSWRLTLIVFGTILVYLCCVVRPMSRLITKNTRRYQSSLGKAAGASTEAVGGMRTVRSFAAEGVEHARYERHIGSANTWWPTPGADNTFRYGVLKHLYGTALISSGFTIVFGALQVSLWVGFLLVTYGELSIGYLTAFQAYQVLPSRRLATPTRGLSLAIALTITSPVARHRGHPVLMLHAPVHALLTRAPLSALGSSTSYLVRGNSPERSCSSQQPREALIGSLRSCDDRHRSSTTMGSRLRHHRAVLWSSSLSTSRIRRARA